jgi:hypothetical protein
MRAKLVLSGFYPRLPVAKETKRPSFKTNGPRGGWGRLREPKVLWRPAATFSALMDDLPQRRQREATTKFRADLPVYQYTLRRTPTRGATTTPRLATGRTTTAAPRAPTQPARYTPRAQTTAFASVVAKATKPPTSNRGIIRCFITVLLELRNESPAVPQGIPWWMACNANVKKNYRECRKFISSTPARCSISLKGNPP